MIRDSGAIPLGHEPMRIKTGKKKDLANNLLAGQPHRVALRLQVPHHLCLLLERSCRRHGTTGAGHGTYRDFLASVHQTHFARFRTIFSHTAFLSRGPNIGFLNCDCKDPTLCMIGGAKGPMHIVPISTSPLLSAAYFRGSPMYS